MSDPATRGEVVGNARRLVCLACDVDVALDGLEVRCDCARSVAHREADGWAYTGPAVVALPLRVHEPEHRRMSDRLIEVRDDDLTYRAHVGPLL